MAWCNKVIRVLLPFHIKGSCPAIFLGSVSDTGTSVVEKVVFVLEDFVVLTCGSQRLNLMQFKSKDWTYSYGKTWSKSLSTAQARLKSKSKGNQRKLLVWILSAHAADLQASDLTKGEVNESTQCSNSCKRTASICGPMIQDVLLSSNDNRS